MMKRIVMPAVALALVAVLLLPQPAQAQDGCGVVASFLFGCDIELRQAEQQHQYEVEAAKVQGQNWAAEQSVRTQQLQLEYNAAVQQANAAANAAAAAQRALSDQEIARVNADLAYKKAQLDASVQQDQIMANERSEQLALMTNAKLASMDIEADLVAAQDDMPMMVLTIVLAALLVSGAGWGLWQWRRVQETKTLVAAGLLPQHLAGYLPQPASWPVPQGCGQQVTVERPAPPSPGMLEKMRYLDERGIRYTWDPERRLLTAQGTNGQMLMLEDKGGR